MVVYEKCSETRTEIQTINVLNSTRTPFYLFSGWVSGLSVFLVGEFYFFIFFVLD